VTAGLTLLAATVMMKTHPRSWWWMGFLGITLSQVVIFTVWSDARQAVSSDGKTFVPLRWSTPVSEYRDFGERRAFFRGEGRWHPPSENTDSLQHAPTYF